MDTHQKLIRSGFIGIVITIVATILLFGIDVLIATSMCTGQARCSVHIAEIPLLPSFFLLSIFQQFIPAFRHNDVAIMTAISVLSLVFYFLLGILIHLIFIHSRKILSPLKIVAHFAQRHWKPICITIAMLIAFFAILMIIEKEYYEREICCPPGGGFNCKYCPGYSDGVVK